MNKELKVTSISYFSIKFLLRLRFKFQFLGFKKKLMMYPLLKISKKKKFFFKLIMHNYRKGLRRKAAVKPENRVLGIKFKDLSPVTPCLRHFEFYGGYKFAVKPGFRV